MKAREIDWSSAEVDRSGALTVRLRGEADTSWMEALEQTFGWMTAETQDGGWDEITWSPETIRVEGVGEESVETLRRFLDSAVKNANQTAEVEAVLSEGGSERPHEVGPEAAARMTDLFRQRD